MRLGTRRTLSAAGSAAVVLTLAWGVPLRSAQSSLSLQPCELPGIAGGGRCGTFEVYENRTAKTGRRIPLNVVVVPALGGTSMRSRVLARGRPWRRGDSGDRSGQSELPPGTSYGSRSRFRRSARHRQVQSTEMRRHRRDAGESGGIFRQTVPRSLDSCVS